jgi:hypothetical protein
MNNLKFSLILKFTTILILILIIKSDKDSISSKEGLTNTITNTNTNSNTITNKMLSKNLKQDVYYGTPNSNLHNNNNDDYVMPHIRPSHSNDDFILQHRTVIPLNNHHGPSEIFHGQPQPHHMGVANCPCASSVQCTPCGVIPNPLVPDMGYPQSMMSPYDCPCAPKLNCPVCPPLSLLHEIASKKVKIFFNLI